MTLHVQNGSHIEQHSCGDLNGSGGCIARVPLSGSSSRPPRAVNAVGCHRAVGQALCLAAGKGGGGGDPDEGSKGNNR